MSKSPIALAEDKKRSLEEIITEISETAAVRIPNDVKKAFVGLFLKARSLTKKIKVLEGIVSELTSGAVKDREAVQASVDRIAVLEAHLDDIMAAFELFKNAPEEKREELMGVAQGFVDEMSQTPANDPAAPASETEAA